MKDDDIDTPKWKRFLYYIGVLRHPDPGEEGLTWSERLSRNLGSRKILRLGTVLGCTQFLDCWA